MPITINGSGTITGASTLATAVVNPIVTTTMGVGNATPAASGSGITFPAAISASSDVNTLDDYEEGTWTPNQGGGLTVVGAFSSAGSYIKVGRLVTVTARLAGATSITASAGSSISTNLPFTAENLAQAGMGSLTNNSIAVTGATWISQNSTTIFATAAVGGTIAIFFNATYIATN